MRAASGIVRGALDYLFGGPAVGGADEERLRRWLALPASDLALAHARARYVAVATRAASAERRTPLAAIAAFAIEGLRIDFGDCFAVAWRTPADGKSALLDFLQFLRKSPLAVMDAAAENARLASATKSLLGVPLDNACIDLRSLLARVTPGERVARSALVATNGPLLDEALACAQALLVAIDTATRGGAANARALLDVARGVPPRP
jgi:hypothetical protein